MSAARRGFWNAVGCCCRPHRRRGGGVLSLEIWDGSIGKTTLRGMRQPAGHAVGGGIRDFDHILYLPPKLGSILDKQRRVNRLGHTALSLKPEIMGTGGTFPSGGDARETEGTRGP